MSEVIDRYLSALIQRRNAVDVEEDDYWNDELDRLWYLMSPEERAIAETKARKRSGDD